MSYFSGTDLDMRMVSDCRISTVEELERVEAHCDARKQEFRERMQALAEERRQLLARKKAGLHGDWNNLVGRQADLLRQAALPGVSDVMGAQLRFRAHELQPTVDHAWTAYREAEAEYLAWQPCYLED